jgi:hypothetical protein
MYFNIFYLSSLVVDVPIPELPVSVSVRPQMVDFGSEQGLSDFETAGIAGYVEEFKRAKTPLWAKRCLLWMGTMWQPETNMSSQRC